MVYILVYNYNKWENMWMVQITSSIKGYWCNIMIIDNSNVYMTMRVYIDDNNIFTRKSPIITPINKWLAICHIVIGNIDKSSVNLEIYFFTNSEILHFMCIIWIGNGEYLPYICRRYLVTFGNVDEKHSIIYASISRTIFNVWTNFGRIIIGVTKIKLT